MSFFSFGGAGGHKAQDVKWVRGPRGDFYRLLMLDDIDSLKVDGLGGVYVVWHGGIRPAWITVGETEDMAATLRRLKKDHEIRQFEVNGGVYVTWSPIVADCRDGVIHYIAKKTQPVITARYDDDELPIPVLLPH